ncbi:DUF4145 domain-containing protein [Candidiatus Paracoxiella cheracis]|uniref:DUF4145 domain-containing protein n=1 Tax=Candidiatus Paracoxiella cheracis TaxID=3405120 RepID=UPI003BF4F655
MKTYQISDYKIGMLCKCNKCNNPICGVIPFDSYNQWGPENDEEAVTVELDRYMSDDSSTDVQLYPKKYEGDVPNHVPDKIRQLYLGVLNTTAAFLIISGCRTVLNETINEKFPHIKGKLVERIYQLHEEHVIPETIKDWISEIRLLGNDATHEAIKIEQAENKTEQVRQAKEFTALFLRYMYELPKEIELSRKARTNAANEGIADSDDASCFITEEAAKT